MKCKIYAEDLHLQFCEQSLLIHRQASSGKYKMVLSHTELIEKDTKTLSKIEKPAKQHLFQQL